MPTPAVVQASGCWLTGFLLLAAGSACAQATPPRAPQRTAPARKEPAPLPPAQVEEALRLLLRADSAGQQHRVRGPESAGLVLDQTLTKLGRDFFELFYGGFEAPPGVAEYTIVLTERPIRAGSALIAFSLDDQELLEMPLPPRYDQMAETVAEAIEVVKSQLLENQRVSRQLDAGQRLRPEVY